MNRIKELREAKNLQQKDLAIDLGFSQPTISDWESGRKTPSTKSAGKIADYFSVTIDYLLGRDEQKEKPAIDTDDGLSDMDKFLFKWLKSLTPEEIEAAQAYIQGRRDAQKD